MNPCQIRRKLDLPGGVKQHHPAPCPAGLVPARRRSLEGNLEGADRGSVDPAVVLAGSFGCRSQRAALGPHSRVLGLASRLRKVTFRARGWGERASDSSMEGVLVMRPVELRLTGPRRLPSLTRRRRRLIWRSLALGFGFGWLPVQVTRQRTSEATSQARRAVENTATGRYRLEGLSIAAPARTKRHHGSREDPGLRPRSHHPERLRQR
jgi:hypothetical protein